ncbi:MAG: hypothetical protein HOW73_05555 [Polyangiaceae bacterium]|nr:hypothetical protein [Polyangiaceae bacterium]
MSRYHDDSTRADHPGGVELSLEKLRILEPQLFTDGTFKCSPTCDVDHPAAEMRERIAEHLEVGDSRAAIVVSVAHLVVAAYSDDLDTVALVRFPPALVAKYGLSVGSRLLTVNTYGQVEAHGQLLYAADIVPGPRRVRWSNFSPFIADFLSDDTDWIESRKRDIPPEEWDTAQARAAERFQ